MKKFLSLAIILSILVCMAACTDNGPSTVTGDTTDTIVSDTADTPETDYTPEWGDFKINESDPKTVAEQRAEIREAMISAINTKVVWEEVPSYAPDLASYYHVSAITYDGFEYQGQKTKVFAYVGFPSGASSETPVPAVVLVHGENGHPYLEWVKKWNNRGYAAIAIDVSGYFPTIRNAGLNERFNSQFTYGLADIFAADGYTNAPDRSYAAEYTEVNEQWNYHALGQVILANSLLRGCERIDSSKIGIVGISSGAVLAIQAVGYDNRFAFAVPIYGAAYLGGELRTYENFGNPYVGPTWALERNLDSASMPILWCANNDDPYFEMSSYVKSYNHTAGLNEKTVLSIMADYRNKHTPAIKCELPYLFADYITGKGGEWITFDTQPSGRDVSCKINIPEEFTGDITATVYYLTKDMAYKTYDKYGSGENEYLDEEWKTSDALTVDKELSALTKGSRTSGKVTVSVPEEYCTVPLDVEVVSYPVEVTLKGEFTVLPDWGYDFSDEEGSVSAALSLYANEEVTLLIKWDPEKLIADSTNAYVKASDEDYECEVTLAAGTGAAIYFFKPDMNAVYNEDDKSFPIEVTKKVGS